MFPACLHPVGWNEAENNFRSNVYFLFCFFPDATVEKPFELEVDGHDGQRYVGISGHRHDRIA